MYDKLTSSSGGKVGEKFFVDEDFKNANPYTDGEREAIRQKIVSDGCLVEPLIVQASTKTLVFGYEELAIAEELNLPYEVKFLEFESKNDCIVWIVEKRMAAPSLNTFQKIEIGRNFVTFWKEKSEARYGEDSPLKKAAFERFGRSDSLAIIAIKSGSSHNTAFKVGKILGSNEKRIIEKCRKGELTISAGYNCIVSGSDGREVTDEELLAAEEKKVQRKQQHKEKEIATLAKYSVDGFASSDQKLDEHGLKFFILRWNEEHVDNCIDESDVQQVIEASEAKEM